MADDLATADSRQAHAAPRAGFLPIETNTFDRVFIAHRTLRRDPSLLDALPRSGRCQLYLSQPLLSIVVGRIIVARG